MDNKTGKIALIVGAIVLGIAGLAFGMKASHAAEDYTPSPGGQTSKSSGGPPPGAVPQMPGGPPAGVAPGTVMDKK